MNAWPRITTLAVRSRLGPRIGRSLALRRPWSASTRLLASWVVSCSAAGRRSVTTRTKAWARGTVALSATDAGLAPIGVVNEHQFGDAHVFTMDFNTGFSAHLMPCAGWSGSMQECPAKTDARAFAIGTHGPSFKVVAVAVTTARRKSGLSGRSRSGLLIPTGFRWPPGRG